MYVPQNMSLINETVLELTIVTSDFKRADYLYFSWNATDFNEK